MTTVPKKTINGKHVKYEIIDNIMYAEFYNSIIHDIQIAREIVEERIELFGDKSYLAVIDITNVKSATKDARKYMSCTKNGFNGIVAAAIISNKLVSMPIYNLFIKINKPEIPIKFFSNKKEAIRWLRNIPKDN
jgi:hypothetical protein